MKLTIITLILVATNTMAVTLNLKTDTTTETTGERIEGAFFDAVTTNVVEEMELHITARSDSATHQLNANSDGMGINNVSTSDDKPARFEVLEKMVLSFDKAIEITKFDFRFFGTNDQFIIEYADTSLEITYDLLSHKSFGFLETNIIISADTDIYFYLAEGDDVAIEAIDLLIQSNQTDLILQLAVSNQWIELNADVKNIGTYQLQSTASLSSQQWHQISTFTASTNWVFPSTNEMHFFRVAP
jgi:hypothetical protein